MTELPNCEQCSDCEIWRLGRYNVMPHKKSSFNSKFGDITQLHSHTFCSCV